MRTLKTVKNTKFALMSQLIILVLNFINRTVFIFILGTDYLGLMGLFSNILSMLSLTELGLGTAIVFCLYKPLATKEINKVKALMNFYKKAYNLIGSIIFLIGLCLSPFIPLLVGENKDIPNLMVIYILYLINSTISYFFTYKRSIIIADQNEYINTLNNSIFLIIQSLLQCIFLLFTHSFIIYLIITICCTIASNLRISIIADKQYPYLKNNNIYLDEGEKKQIYKYIFAQMSHKVGGVIVSGTDNILISTFIGISYVGIYSNYVMVINIIKTILNTIFSSASASIGNLVAMENNEKSLEVYNKLLYINFFFYGISTICIYYLINDFIIIWIGEDYILSKPLVVLIIINFLINGLRQTTILYNTSLGLFWHDRYKPIFEAFINLIFSIILMKKFGFIGVFGGTLISTISTSFWVEPYILFKYGFKRSAKQYFINYIRYLGILSICLIVTYPINNIIEHLSLISLGIRAILILLVSILIFILCTYGTKEFKYIKCILINILNKFN